MKERLSIFLIGIILAIIILFVIDRLILPPTANKIEIQRDTLIVVDTIQVPKKIYITKIKADIDTVFIDSTTVMVAKADTIINQDSSRLKVSYYFPPANYFDIQYDLKEKIIEKIKTITELNTVTVEKEEPFYENEFVYISAILLTILLLR